MRSKNDAQARLAHARDGAVSTIGYCHATALRSARLSGLLGDCRLFPVRPWRAVCCSGAGGACAEHRPPRWWTQACGHASSASCPHSATSGHGSSSRRCRAVGLSRPGDGSTADTPDPRDLGLVDVRDVHRDRLGSQLGLLCRPLGDWEPMRRPFGDDNHSGAASNRRPISIDHSLKRLNYVAKSQPASW